MKIGVLIIHFHDIESNAKQLEYSKLLKLILNSCIMNVLKIIEQF